MISSQPKQYLTHCQQELRQAREAGDERQVSLALANLGHALFQQRCYEDGLHQFEQAVEQAAAMADIQLQAHCLSLKMIAFQDIPRLPDAYRVAEEIRQLGQSHNHAGLQCDALTSQGQILLESGEPTIATEKLQAAQQLAEQLADPRRQMNVLGMLGHVGLATVAPEQAETCFDRAQALAAELGDTTAEVGFMGNKAIVLAWRGNFSRAVAAFEQVRSHAEKTGNQKAEVQALCHLVKAYIELHNDQKAVNCARRALDLDRQDDSEQRFFFYETAVRAWQRLGRMAEAQKTLSRATQWVQKISHRPQKFEFLLKLAELHDLLQTPNTIDIYLATLDQAILLNRQQDQKFLISRLGELITDSKQLIEVFEPRLPQIVAQADHPSEQSMLHSLIKACREAGENSKVINYTRQILPLAEAAANHNLTNRYQVILLEALSQAGQYQQAIEIITSALNSKAITNDKATQLYLLLMLADVYTETNQVEAAIRALEAALPWPKQTQQPQLEARILGQLGSIYADLGELECSINYTNGAIDLARRLEDNQTVGELLCLLSLNYQDLGQTSQALMYCNQAIKTFREINDSTLAAKALTLKQQLQPM